MVPVHDDPSGPAQATLSDVDHRASLQPENPIAILRDVRRFLNERQDIDFPDALYQRIDAAVEGRPARTFPVVYCAQCGQSFGPAVAGFSRCSEHRRVA